jgi:hypothetical protein
MLVGLLRMSANTSRHIASSTFSVKEGVRGGIVKVIA